MNVRRIIGVCFLVFLATISKGQEDFGVLYWTPDRDLDWSDFQGTSLTDTSSNFFLDLYIESVTVNNSSFFVQSVYDPKTYIFTKTSYVDENLRSDDLLRYLNVYYDLAAVYAHKMVKQLIKGRNSEDTFISSNLHIVKNAVIEEWRNESARLAIETQYGVEIERLLMWEKEVGDRLARISEPVFTKSDFSMTLDFTFGPIVGFNEYKEFLTQPIGGVLGIEVAKAPFTFNFGLSGGGASVIKSFVNEDEIFLLDTKPNMLNLFMHTGYQLVNTKRWMIIPRIGIHYTSLRYPVGEDLTSKVSKTSFTSGATIDYRLNSWNKNGNRSMMFSEIGLRFGGYYYPMNVGAQNLSHMLFTLGFSWTFGPINVDYP